MPELNSRSGSITYFMDVFSVCLPVYIIGPGAQPPTVRTSGTDVDQVLTSFPADVFFPIIDDSAALEDMEIYTLTLIPSDPSIDIVQDTSQITILDNDGKLHQVCHLQRLMHSWLHVYIAQSTIILFFLLQK